MSPRRREGEDSRPGRDGQAGGAEEAEPAPDQSEAISEELLRELEELDELRDRHLRLAAEFENYRKRTRQELATTRTLAQAELTGRLLDALDDLDRVASTPIDSTTVESLHEGVDLVHRKLLKELRDAGLEPVDAEGQAFDPNLHEALLTTPTDDPEEDERVSRVLVAGYRFGDRLLRPARVEVKKHEPSAAEAGDRGTDAR